MRKYFIRIGLFILSFAFGISIVALLNYIYTPQMSRIDCDLRLVDENEIGIEFKQFAETDYGFAAEFEITNRTDKTLYYKAYNDYKSGQYFITETEYKIDGNIINEWRCQNGLEIRKLKPNGKKILKTISFSQMWKKDKSIEVGFNLGFAPEEFKTYWSDRLIITSDIEKKLIAEQKKMYLYRQANH